jgi:4-hydroxybenzoyl-CoA reductase subunit alpha
MFRDRERPESSLSFAEVAARACRDQQPVTGFARKEEWLHGFEPAFVAQVAEVEVDPETGQVTLRQVVSATDVGTVLNPIGVTGQLEGAMVMGMGYASIEELQFGDRGEVVTAGLHDYKLPTVADLPKAMQNHLITGAQGPGPYGAKAVGELTHLPLPSAIANAIYDAVGVRITQLPIVPQKVLQGLKEREQLAAESTSGPREAVTSVGA